MSGLEVAVLIRRLIEGCGRAWPADFAKLLTEETEKWAKVIKFAGIKAD